MIGNHNYINPDIESSYKKNNIGKTIYDVVIKYKPKTVVEFGTLYGYSAVAIAQALQKNNNKSELICYDLWEDYKYKHSNVNIAKQNIEKYGLSDIVTFKKINYYDWLKAPTHFDLLHIDISNDGNVILDAFYHLSKNDNIIMFEGGSIERDNIKWMKLYDKLHMNVIKSIVKYRIINNNFPSISIM
jgi:predicted O-methyltransferase YrrM